MKSLPFVLLALVGCGCQFMETVESTKIPQSEIKQFYTVAATRGETRVTASLNQGAWGKSVDLDAPSRIEHNGAELPQNTINFLTGTYYQKTFTGLERTHRFVYTNNDGAVFRNELAFEPLEIDAGGAEIAIARGAETRVRLSRAVGPDEKISIALRSALAPPEPANGAANAAKKPAAEYELDLDDELDETRAAIVLKPKNLKKFVAGRASLTVEVSGERPLQQATAAGGALRWSYSSKAAARVEK